MSSRNAFAEGFSAYLTSLVQLCRERDNMDYDQFKINCNALGLITDELIELLRTTKTIKIAIMKTMIFLILADAIFVISVEFGKQTFDVSIRQVQELSDDSDEEAREVITAIREMTPIFATGE